LRAVVAKGDLDWLRRGSGGIVKSSRNKSTLPQRSEATAGTCGVASRCRFRAKCFQIARLIVANLALQE
jgi:hypothetical protein